ncbi:hypothetical protein DPSP01_012027 [Paraphaeosphaeria sporulosa]|uniref:Uncharacterized protein n=1 Tax=Paraphaeosphaeria sporulosa TaxID=1460663 RepID=A0A177C6R7_9PLEO|nr:uncharacterized protein CC84DRAFT_1220202 [Paraphaeosphaeria sporulosa]OAG03333.1 hypothetical protein CC84DRAFT_1220202 [Paraphaeosphaeria sporulosa]
MPSYDHFQPPPPIRTATSGSQKSHSSDTASPDMHSPTSMYSRSPTSPGEDSFFSAISAKIRSRSRSRSRAASPEHSTFQRTPTAHPTSPTYATQHPKQPRHVSSASQGSIGSSAAKAQRPTMPMPSRRSTSNSDLWRGRHSNSWLFNDFSFTETASKAFKRSS